MKTALKIAAVVMILIMTACVAVAMDPPYVRLVCDENGHKFTGEEWTLVRIDDSVMRLYGDLDNKEKALQLRDYAINSNLPGTTGVVDENGIIEFPVERSSYLLYRTKVLDDMYSALPIVFSIPEVVGDKEYYNIEIKAKISYGDSNGSAPGSDIDTEFDTEGRRNGGDGPSTGDDNPKKLAFLFMTLVLSLTGLVIVQKSKKSSVLYE